MAPKNSVTIKGRTFHFFEKSIRMDGIAETLFMGRKPTDTDVAFLCKVFQAGYNQKAQSVRNLLEELHSGWKD